MAEPMVRTPLAAAKAISEVIKEAGRGDKSGGARFVQYRGTARPLFSGALHELWETSGRTDHR